MERVQHLKHIASCISGRSGTAGAEHAFVQFTNLAFPKCTVIAFINKDCILSTSDVELKHLV